MRRSAVILGIASLLLLVAGSPRHPRPVQPPADLEPFVAGNTTFALDLHRRLAEPGGNLIHSPYSATVALALAQSGARGATEQQIAGTLHAPSPDELQAALSCIRTSLTAAARQKHVELATAAGLWAQADYGWDSKFLQLARDAFAAEVQFADFRSRSDALRGQINGWVCRQTRDKIQDALPLGTPSTDTRLVFVNTLYFKGQWASCFARRHTHEKPFRVSPERSGSVPMMWQAQVARYAESETAQMVELPYVGSDLSMTVLLPRSPDGLKELEQQLSWNQITNWVARAGVRTVDLELPRFKIASRLPLIEPLRSLGLTDAFVPAKADFTGMTPRRPLYINFLHQCAIVEVNEEGTVAAAATSGGLACSSQPRPATFHADHPFLFFIRDNHTGAILFLGRVTNPAQPL
jgi:serpin B